MASIQQLPPLAPVPVVVDSNDFAVLKSDDIVRFFGDHLETLQAHVAHNQNQPLPMDLLDPIITKVHNDWVVKFQIPYGVKFVLLENRHVIVQAIQRSIDKNKPATVAESHCPKHGLSIVDTGKIRTTENMSDCLEVAECHPADVLADTVRFCCSGACDDCEHDDVPARARPAAVSRLTYLKALVKAFTGITPNLLLLGRQASELVGVSEELGFVPAEVVATGLQRHLQTVIDTTTSPAASACASLLSSALEQDGPFSRVLVAYHPSVWGKYTHRQQVEEGNTVEKLVVSIHSLLDGAAPQDVITAGVETFKDTLKGQRFFHRRQYEQGDTFPYWLFSREQLSEFGKKGLRTRVLAHGATEGIPNDHDKYVEMLSSYQKKVSGARRYKINRQVDELIGMLKKNFFLGDETLEECCEDEAVKYGIKIVKALVVNSGYNGYISSDDNITKWDINDARIIDTFEKVLTLRFDQEAGNLPWLDEFLGDAFKWDDQQRAQFEALKTAATDVYGSNIKTIVLACEQDGILFYETRAKKDAKTIEDKLRKRIVGDFGDTAWTAASKSAAKARGGAAPKFPANETEKHRVLSCFDPSKHSSTINQHDGKTSTPVPTVKWVTLHEECVRTAADDGEEFRLTSKQISSQFGKEYRSDLQQVVLFHNSTNLSSLDVAVSHGPSATKKSQPGIAAFIQQQQQPTAPDKTVSGDRKSNKRPITSAFTQQQQQQPTAGATTVAGGRKSDAKQRTITAFLAPQHHQQRQQQQSTAPDTTVSGDTSEIADDDVELRRDYKRLCREHKVASDEDDW